MRNDLLRIAARLAAGGLVCGAAAAAPPVAVGDALDRPALQLRHPERAVTLAAARAGERLVAVGERGLVLLSDDRGAHWRQARSPVSTTLTAVRFVDATHGAAVGHGGVVMTTADAGQTWTLQLDGRRLAQRALEAARASGDALRVRDAERLLADGPDKPFLDLLMWDARTMLAVGAYGLAFHTADGGAHWTPWADRLPNPRALHLYAVRRDGASLLVAGEQGLLLRSDDGGASFRPLASPYKGSWFTAELRGPELLLAGLRGNAWRSLDDGATWKPLAQPVPASITASATDADGGVYLTSQAGYVLQLQGDTLRPLNAQPLPPLNGLLALPDPAGGWLLALGVTGPQAIAARAAGAGASR